MQTKTKPDHSHDNSTSLVTPTIQVIGEDELRTAIPPYLHYSDRHHHDHDHHHHPHHHVLHKTQQSLVKTLIYPDPNPPGEQQESTLSKSISGHKVKCLKSLEPLITFENLLLHRRPENSIELSPQNKFLAFAQYDIVNSEGKQLYIAVEQATHKSVFWVKDARLFDVSLYDHNCNKILSIRRKCSCSFIFAQYCCLFCTFGFKGCGNAAVVTLTNEDKMLGYVSQRLSCSQTVLDIYDENKKHCLCIFGDLLDGIFDIFFADDDIEPIAMIETSMTASEVLDFYGISVSEYEDPYGITFFSPKITPGEKALIISAVILMDYIFCKPNTDYPHWLQFLPIDYKNEDQTYQKVFKDRSKEIIVTSHRPVITRRNIIRDHRKFGCCRWFCGFVCICCPLGMARNALRCTSLILFSIVMVFLLTLVILWTAVRLY